MDDMGDLKDLKIKLEKMTLEGEKISLNIHENNKKINWVNIKKKK